MAAAKSDKKTLIEAWHQLHFADEVNIYYPPQPEKYPEHCFRVADADWRYMMRFETCRHHRVGKPDAPQDRYDFDLNDPNPNLQELLAAAEPMVARSAESRRLLREMTEGYDAG